MFTAELANFFVAIFRTVQPEFCCRNIHNEDNESQSSQVNLQDPIGENEGDEMFLDEEHFPSQNNDRPNFNDREQIQQSMCKSFRESLQTNSTILVASVIPLALFPTMLLYGDLNSSNLCFETKHHNGSRQVTSIMKYKLIGESIEVVFLTLWFPVSTLLLFGTQEFKSHYLMTLLFNFFAGLTIVVYKAVLFLFGVLGTKQFYRYPGNVVYFLGIFSSGVYIARKINRTVRPWLGYSFCLIFFLTEGHFVTGFACAMVYRYQVVPWFNDEGNETKKALIAAIAPIIATIPTALFIYLVLTYSHERFIRPNRTFVVVYLVRAISIALYRIMQADFKSLGLFIALSVFHGCLNLAGKATERKREKYWSSLVHTLRNTFRCTKLTLLPYKLLLLRKLQAGIDIQDMLLEFTTIILSQAYVALYLYSSFEMTLWAAIKEPLIRISIGLSIDFLFNCLTIFVANHYNKVPIVHVWNKHWKRHIAASFIILIVMVSYFNQVLFAIFQIRLDDHGQKYQIRNCTKPFSN